MITNIIQERKKWLSLIKSIIIWLSMLLKRSIRDETLKNRCRIVLVGTFHKYVINGEWKTSKNGVICRCTLDLDSLLVDYNAFSSYRRLSMIFMLTQAFQCFQFQCFLNLWCQSDTLALIRESRTSPSQLLSELDTIVSLFIAGTIQIFN